MNKKLNALMKKYKLTIKDLPAFPKPVTDLEKLIKVIGEAKKNLNNMFKRILRAMLQGILQIIFPKPQKQWGIRKDGRCPMDGERCGVCDDLTNFD